MEHPWSQGPHRFWGKVRRTGHCPLTGSLLDDGILLLILSERDSQQIALISDLYPYRGMKDFPSESSCQIRLWMPHSILHATALKCARKSQTQGTPPKCPAPQLACRVHGPIHPSDRTTHWGACQPGRQFHSARASAPLKWSGGCSHSFQKPRCSLRVLPAHARYKLRFAEKKKRGSKKKRISNPLLRSMSR